MNRGFMRASKPVLPNTVTARQTFQSPANTSGVAIKSPANPTIPLMDVRNSQNLPVNQISPFGSQWLYGVEQGGVFCGALQGLGSPTVNSRFTDFTVNAYLDSSGNWQRISTAEWTVLNQIASYDAGQGLTQGATSQFQVAVAAPAANPVGNFVFLLVCDGISGNTGIGNNVVNTGPGALLFPQAPLHVSFLDTGTNSAVVGQIIEHASSGVIAAGFGVGLLFELQSSTTAARASGQIQSAWTVATDASRTARMAFFAYDAAGAREGIRIESNGSAATLGFFGAAAVAKPTVTGSRGGNAALASLLTSLANEGLITDSTTA